ncbi:hypothetical protein F5B20DRAFT_589259 [Whalleya microplaca]|nr:hypothetical protein F5B20DRAFT_589259 [Whalleya microplaca]
MGRPRTSGYKPARARKNKFRDYVPRVGFILKDYKVRMLLDAVDTTLVKNKIKDFSDGLNKDVVDQALAYVFDGANQAMEEDPSAIAETTPALFWQPIKNAVHWTRDFDAGIIFQLVVALLAAHEKYDEARPYEKFKNQYGRSAESCHKFSSLLKQHHSDNYLLMSLYFKTKVSLDSDDEADDEGSDDNKEPEGPSDPDGDTVMEEAEEEGEPKGKKRSREDGENQEQLGSKRREMGLGEWVYTEEEAELVSNVGAMNI